MINLLALIQLQVAAKPNQRAILTAFFLESRSKVSLKKTKLPLNLMESKLNLSQARVENSSSQLRLKAALLQSLR
jgi:hypothetical protein